MQAYRFEAPIQQDGVLTLHNAPLQAGQTVEVIILIQPPTTTPPTRIPQQPYPLHIQARHPGLSVVICG